MTSTFQSDLDVRQIGWGRGKPLWWTLAPLTYQSDRLNSTVTIPAEFITDLASVPRLPLAYLLAGGKGNRAAVVHDFAYQFGYWWAGGVRLTVTKTLADEVFLEALRADPWSGASPSVARLMWIAVTIGGSGVWADHLRTNLLNPEWSVDRWESA